MLEVGKESLEAFAEQEYPPSLISPVCVYV